jgi:hypothetical protein
MDAADDDGFDPSVRGEFRLMSHVLQKGLQAGGLLGALIAGGTAAYQRSAQGRPVSLLQLAHTTGVSCLVGLGVTGEGQFRGN